MDIYSKKDIEVLKEKMNDINKEVKKRTAVVLEPSISDLNKVADIAEEEQHHPDIIISYNKVTIELWTHAIAGLSENDFILASKIDHILAE